MNQSNILDKIVKTQMVINGVAGAVLVVYGIVALFNGEGFGNLVIGAWCISQLVTLNILRK